VPILFVSTRPPPL